MSDTSFQEDSRVMRAICAEPWAITPEALEQIVTIAQRLHDAPESLRDQLRQNAAEAVLTSPGQQLQGTRRVRVRNQTAIVPISGPIFRYANLFTELSGATSIQVLAQDFQVAAENRDIERIILEVDSPGGQVTGVSEFADQVRAAADGKDVTAYIAGSGTSAAYWIAAAASSVAVSDTALAGSIGTVLRVMIDDDKHAVRFISSQSPYKQADPTTENGRSSYQAMVDRLTDVFMSAVAQFRGVDVDTVLSRFGQGGVLVGADAVAAGMADEVTALESLIAGTSGGNTKRGVTMSDSDKTYQRSEITRELIAAEFPDLLSTIQQEGAEQARESAYNEGHAAGHAEGLTAGAKQECERIKAVHAQSMTGHEKLIEQLMFDGETTGPEAATQILAAEKRHRTNHLQQRQADGQTTVLPDATAPNDDDDRVDADDKNLTEDQKIEKDWKADAALRAEFGDNFDRFKAYRKAQSTGQVRERKAS